MPRHKHEGVPPRRRQVLIGMANGRKDTQIARELGVSEATVKTHVRLLLRQFGVGERASVVIAALRQGLIQPREVPVMGECPGTTIRPNYCRCSCPGCKDSCEFHYGESGPALAA